MFFFKEIGELTVLEVSILWWVISVLYLLVKNIILRIQYGGDGSAPIKESDAVLLDLRDTKLGWQWGIFQVEEGQRARVKLNEDHVYVIGDKGYLKWQGLNIIKFEYGKSMENIIKEKEKKNSDNTWRCKFCGDANLLSWEKCSKCGKKKGTEPAASQKIVNMQPEKRVPICPRCRKICMEGVAFCGNCGAKL